MSYHGWYRPRGGKGGLVLLASRTKKGEKIGKNRFAMACFAPILFVRFLFFYFTFLQIHPPMTLRLS